MDIIGWILTTNSITGAFLNSRKKIQGFYLWTVGNFGWVLWALYHEIYPQAILFFIYLMTSIYGIIEWRKKKEKK